MPLLIWNIIHYFTMFFIHPRWLAGFLNHQQYVYWFQGGTFLRKRIINAYSRQPLVEIGTISLWSKKGWLIVIIQQFLEVVSFLCIIIHKSQALFWGDELQSSDIAHKYAKYFSQIYLLHIKYINVVICIYIYTYI